MVVADATFHRISIKHSGFNPDSVIEASFEILGAGPDIMNEGAFRFIVIFAKRRVPPGRAA
jgi:hypothetical protein